MRCYACDAPATGTCAHLAHAPACRRHATHKGIGNGWGLSVRAESLRALDKRARVLRSSVASLVHSVRRPEREGDPRHGLMFGVDGSQRAGSGVSA